MTLWRLRGLGKVPFARTIARGLFSAVYRDGRTITIKRGPLKGYRWVCHRDHQFWMPLGLYEAETSSWLREHIEEGMTFIDIGANAGYFTLLGSKCTGNDGATVAFEPVPASSEIIRSHLAANHISNVKVEEMVVSSASGELDYTIEETNANSHIANIDINHAVTSARQIIKVRAITLDDYIRENNLKPGVIKIDVEGAEMSVLEGALETLKSAGPACIVSTHSAELRDRCMQFFTHAGYSADRLPGFEHELCCFPTSCIR